jgi:hypothetical protein
LSGPPTRSGDLRSCALSHRSSSASHHGGRTASRRIGRPSTWLRDRDALDAVATRLLRTVERLIGQPKQRDPIVAVVRRARDPDRDADAIGDSRRERDQRAFGAAPDPLRNGERPGLVDAGKATANSSPP